MRVVFITQDFPPDVGGIESFSVELCNLIASHFDDFAVVAPSKNKEDEQKVDSSLGYDVIRYWVPDNSSLPYRLELSLAKLSKKRNFDLSLHAQWQTMIPALKARNKGLLKKCLCIAHGREILFNPFESSKLLGKWFNQRLKYSLMQGDYFFSNSRYTKSLLVDKGVDESKIDLIGMGVKTEEFYPIPTLEAREKLGLNPNDKILLTTTRLVHRKGVDDVIRAVSYLNSNGFDDFKYIIVGDGPERERLEKMVLNEGVGHIVEFKGRVPYEHLLLYYNACSIFCMPSRTELPDVEGFGIVFLEANACGKAVIGSRSGGIPDAIEDGVNGLLVDENNPKELSNTIYKLLNDDKQRVQLGEQGLKRVLDSFTWQHLANKCLDRMNKFE